MKKIILESEQEIIPRNPTKKQLEKFASNFTNPEWIKLSSDRRFREVLLENLDDAKNRAEEILKKQIKFKK